MEEAKEEIVEENVYKEEDKTGETEEEKTEEIQEGEAEKTVYSEEAREMMLDEDAIAPWEEAFMEGAEGRGSKTSCRYCGKLLGQDKSSIVERKIGAEIFLFCCNECAEKFMKKRGKKLIEKA